MSQVSEKRLIYRSISRIFLLQNSAVQTQWPTHCCSGANFPVMAFRTSWLARPPTAAANGGRVPLAVLDRQRTNSVFKEAWEEVKRERTEQNLILKGPVCVQSEKKNENMIGLKKTKNKTQTLLTLFLRVKFTSSVSFSKISASFKHLDASEEKYTQPGQMIFFSIVSIQESWFEFREISVYPMLGSRECCSWKLSSANKPAWICSGAWWGNLENIAGKQLS